MRFNDKVEQVDVDEALRLIEVSRSSINDEEKGDKNAYSARGDIISQIFLVIREMCLEKKDKTVKMTDIERKIVAKNFTSSNLELCLKEYINLGVLYQNSDGTEITLL